MVKRDRVKIIAIVLAIVFFLFWIIGTTTNTSEINDLTNKYNDLYANCKASSDVSNSLTNLSVQVLVATCKASLNNLDSQWQSSFNTLLNCYKNSVASCDYTTPTLNLTG